MGISDTFLCSYCQLHNETITHLFLECDIAKALWSDLQLILHEKIDLPDINLLSVSFGFIDTPHKINYY